MYEADCQEETRRYHCVKNMNTNKPRESECRFLHLCTLDSVVNVNILFTSNTRHYRC
jgi:hypothetical protein